MLSKKWVLAKPLSEAYLRQYGTISPVLAQVLSNRGVDSPRAVERFLYTREYTATPFTDMPKAVDLILRTIKRRDPIVVYGDFDADGVTSTAVMVHALRELKADVIPYIPHRVDEGYGLNTPALQDLAKQGKKLIITVDCGIRSVQEVDDAKAAGLDIIITDHHSLGPELPRADAIVNPQREEDPMLIAGVGVAYLMARALHREAQKTWNNGRKPFDPDDLLDLVAIGTVADLMPLNRVENRRLVSRGLEKLNSSPRPGVQALMEIINADPGTVTASTIGFGLGPRINAAGRLDSALIAYALLMSPNLDEARHYAEKLQELNSQRQEYTRDAQETVKEYLDETETDEVPLIFAADSSFKPGIVGLVAGRITEEYFRPSVVVQEGESESHASCRSIPQFNITTALDQCADLLVRHGGHALAAGFTVMNENIPALRDRLITMANDSLRGQALVPMLEIDLAIDIHRLNKQLVEELSLLEPCGNGNPLPIFMSKNVHVAECRAVGKDGKHLKLKISRASQPPLDAIGFGLGVWTTQMPDRIDIAYQLEINDWNGRQYLQANLQDIRPAKD